MKAIIKNKHLTNNPDDGIVIDIMYVAKVGLAKDFCGGCDDNDTSMVSTEHTDAIEDALVFDLSNPKDYQIVSDLMNEVNVPDQAPGEYEMLSLGFEIVLLDYEKTSRRKKKVA